MLQRREKRVRKPTHVKKEIRSQELAHSKYDGVFGSQLSLSSFWAFWSFRKSNCFSKPEKSCFCLFVWLVGFTQTQLSQRAMEPVDKVVTGQTQDKKQGRGTLDM